MYIKADTFKEKILNAYVAGESKTHKNAQDYYKKWFLTKTRIVKEPPNQVITTSVCAHVWETMSGKVEFVEKCSICGERR